MGRASAPATKRRPGMPVRSSPNATTKASTSVTAVVTAPSSRLLARARHTPGVSSSAA